MSQPTPLSAKQVAEDICYMLEIDDMNAIRIAERLTDWLASQTDAARLEEAEWWKDSVLDPTDEHTSRDAYARLADLRQRAEHLERKGE